MKLNLLTLTAKPLTLDYSCNKALILLDFVIAYIVLALAGYAVSVFLPGRVGQIILTVVAAILLLPLFVEALGLRGVLRSVWKNGEHEDHKN